MIRSRPRTTEFTLFGSHGRKWILIFLLAAAGPVAAEVTTLKLRNGDRLTGEVIRQEKNSITLSNAWSPEIVIPISEIELPVFEQIPAASGSTTNVVKSSDTSETKPPKKEPPPKPEPKSVAVAKPEPEKKWTEYWKGEVEVGLDLLRGERDRDIYSGRAKLTYVKKRFRNIFDYSYAYGETDGTVSTDRMWGSSKTDFDVLEDKRIYVYNLGTVGYDSVRRIDLRYSFGPGVGYHLIKKKNFVMDGETGLNYQVEERDDGTRNKDFYLRFAESITWKINSRTTLEEDFEFLPEAENLDSFRLRFETSLSYLLVKNLFLKASAIDTYETNPAQNVERNELQIRSSLNYKF